MLFGAIKYVFLEGVRVFGLGCISPMGLGFLGAVVGPFSLCCQAPQSANNSARSAKASGKALMRW